jgi:hypothetical protein
MDTRHFHSLDRDEMVDDRLDVLGIDRRPAGRAHLLDLGVPLLDRKRRLREHHAGGATGRFAPLRDVILGHWRRHRRALSQRSRELSNIGLLAPKIAIRPVELGDLGATPQVPAPVAEFDCEVD